MADQGLVFVSANSTDFVHAERVYDYLHERGVPVFLSSRSLPELGDSDYRKVIDAQLDRCTHMVVVTSSSENVESPWVEAEWGFFINAKRSRTKTGNVVTVAVGDLNPATLPPSLRYYEVISLREDSLSRLLRYVSQRSVDAPPNLNDVLPGSPDAGGRLFPDLDAYSGNGPTIKMFAVGGAGNAVVEIMVRGGPRGMPTVLITTDSQVATASRADVKVLIGNELTRGLGSGGNPDIARRAAEQDAERLRAALGDCDIAFLSAGLGGGTGSGATPILARIAREMGIVTICFVSLPFGFEGPARSRQARAVLTELATICDVVVPVSSDRILQTLSVDLPMARAFERVAELHEHWIAAIGDLPQGKSLVNLDFADLRTAFQGGGIAGIGQGEAAGDDRAAAAVTSAIRHGYLSDRSLNMAATVFLILECRTDLSLQEMSTATETLAAACDPEADIIFSHRTDENMGDGVRAIVMALRFQAESAD